MIVSKLPEGKAQITYIDSYHSPQLRRKTILLQPLLTITVGVNMHSDTDRLFDNDSHHLIMFENSLMGCESDAGGAASGSLPLSASLIHFRQAC